MTTIERKVDEFGNVILTNGNRVATVSIACPGLWDVFAQASGCSLRTFCGKTYKSQATAERAALKWLVHNLA